MAKSKKQNKSTEKNVHKPSSQAPKLHLADETKRAIAVIVFVVLSVITALSLIDLAGSFGRVISRIAASLLGVMAYTLPLLFLLVAGALVKQKQAPDVETHGYLRTYVGVTLLTGSIAGLIHIFYLGETISAFSLATAGRAGGYVGALFAGPLFGLFGFWAGAFLLIALLVVAILITFNISFHQLLPKKDETPVSPAMLPKDSAYKINNPAGEAFVDKDKRMDPPSEPQQKIIVPKPIEAAEELKQDSIILEDRKDWKLPPFDLLDDNKTEVDSGNIEHNVSIIQKTLHDFGIEVEMGEVNVGPTVTQYTLTPAAGVKLSRIGELQNNLALALSAQSIRMELPIPGKSLVGIEVPNKSTSTVRLREVMQTSDFINHKSKLAVALGRDVAGGPMVIDIGKMPHLLIAGASNMGKSVSLNSLFISLLYRNTPQDIKFIIIDPKRVEFTPYNGIPHLLAPIITERDKAINALKWAVAEMDRRYKLLAEAGKRNITEYNDGASLPLSYIVIIVDELADLMTSSEKSEVESAIVRLAQMARAVGVHLVLATQRPSVEVITGLIKANITARVAFTVGSQVDSRTILDASGAEKLLGNGDMLFASADFIKPKRVQGAYVAEKEVKRVVDFFKNQAGAVIYNEDITEKAKKTLGLPGMGGGDGDTDDELFEAAKEEVFRAGKASASLLQRRLRIGYARAARLLDILEEQGIIGPGDGAKPREVYGVVPDEEKAEYGVEGDEETNRNDYNS
ncbi:MAG: DNA translocase FtsK 4TM domain-containing protein [Candidatus Doudnabacteria bacterium]|nr:DNA translocase FtsK 4TM domain-containing protein [Candidatus Doudnabacteria bacterium]